MYMYYSKIQNAWNDNSRDYGTIIIAIIATDIMGTRNPHYIHVDCYSVAAQCVVRSILRERPNLNHYTMIRKMVRCIILYMQSEKFFIVSYYKLKLVTYYGCTHVCTRYICYDIVIVFYIHCYSA